MRVLFTVYSDKSLFLSMAPLAWALRGAGHEVRVASPRGLTDVITQAGLTAVQVGRDDGIIRILDEDPQAQADLRPGLPAPYDVAEDPDKATWEHLKAGFDEQVTWWHKMVNTPMIPNLVAFARHWQPDLIIWEPNTYAGAIAAKACGAAHARLLWSMDVFGVARDHFRRLCDGRKDVLADWLGGYATRFGGEYTEDMATGQFTITQLPDSLSARADVEYVPMRYVPYGGAAVVPDWLRGRPERPRIALTLGVTSTERFGGYTVGVQQVLESLSDVDFELVATIADKERDKLGRLPDNARIVPYVPLHALVPTCDAVIHHAGPGTLCTTALYGVPQLALPWHFDEPLLAGKLAAHGAGAMIHSDDATGDVVRDQVLRVLGDPAFRTRAADLRDEMLAMPTPNEVVGQLEKLTSQVR